MSPVEARDELLKCCGSRRWAEAVAAGRPYRSEGELAEAADRVWRGLGGEDWLEAFRAHPKIGERKAAARVSEEARGWSEREQSAASAASAETLSALAEGNRAYEEKFGFIFIICATGRSGDEILTALRERLRNSPEDEIKIAAGEQLKITRLRLEKLLRT